MESDKLIELTHKQIDAFKILGYWKNMDDFIYTKLFKGYETHHKNRAMKESKPRLSPRMARQIAKNLMLCLDIETLILHPDSPESDWMHG